MKNETGKRQTRLNKFLSILSNSAGLIDVGGLTDGGWQSHDYHASFGKA